MPAPSLVSMARRACTKHIRSIRDVGDATYDTVRPVLIKIENPKQLREIEKASPQIIGHDAEIWIEMIKRDVSDWEETLHEPKDPQNWYKMYLTLLKGSRDRINKDAKLLKATMDGIQSERSKHKLQRIELDGVKLADDMKPGGPTVKFDHKINLIDRGVQHGKAPSKREIQIGLGKLDANAPRKKVEPKGIIAQFRKDAKANPRFLNQPKKPIGTITTREMTARPKLPKGIIYAREMARKPKAKVPCTYKGTIEGNRNAAVPQFLDPSIQSSPAPNPLKRKVMHDDEPLPVSSELAQREKRLKTFTSIPTPNASALIKTIQSKGPSPPYSSPNSQNTRLAVNGSSHSSPPQTITPSSSPPPLTKTSPRNSPAPIGLSRSNSSSPNNGGVPPPKTMKRKAPVDIFLRPTKKVRRLS